MQKKRESFEKLVMCVAVVALVVWFGVLSACATDAGEPRMTSGPRVVHHAVPAIDADPIHNPAGSQMLVAQLTIVPTCDGYIDATEWADAYMYDISDTTGQSDGIVDPPGTVILWLKQDDIGVYFAIRNNADATLDDYDQCGLYFDDNHDGCFSSSATTEGNQWLEYHPTGSLVNWRWIQDTDCGFPPSYVCSGDDFGAAYPWTPSCFGIGIGPTGVVDYEIMIPYGSVDEHLDLTMPPDSLGFFIYCYDYGTGNFHGEWPNQGRADTWREPCYYGHLVCEAGEPWADHKMHFPQLPDEIGWDVLSTAPRICADDWQCSETGWVTDIHFWGSWKDLDGVPQTDDYPPGGEMPEFAVFILRNIPADLDTHWSRPGEILWEWWGEIPGTPLDPPTYEGWYDPDTGFALCNDHTPYWRYDFFVEQAYPPADSFFQYQDSIYWLAVAPVDTDLPYQWGWKNSRDHFMDDATYSDDPYTGPWFEMYEPPRCNWFDAFFITGTVSDYGSTNYYGDGWYYYPMFGWTNMWFYDNPFTYEHEKHIWMEFYLEDLTADAEFALNWSTPEWDEMGMGRPPLPEDGYEDIFIGRQQFPVVYGWNTVDFWLPHNPEWISIDFRGTMFFVNGWIWHECVGTSLDLAFVITGEPPAVICGDVNNDGIVNIGDVVYMVGYLYKSGPAPIPMPCVGDVNNDDIVNVGDIVYLVAYLYKGGPAPDPNCCNPAWKNSESDSTPRGEHWWIR